MSTTGAKIAGTGTSVTRGAGTAWTNPGNITANDGTVASCTGGASGAAYLRASNFGFSIPTGSLIQGFTVVFDMAESSTGTELVSIQLVGPAATAIGSAQTQTVNGTTLTLYTLGSGTDLWGTSGVTAADINDTDFGVYLWYTTTHNTTVDYISIDVNYEAPISGSLAATESGTDTASFNGTVSASGITGSLSATESGADTASISGDVFVQGSLAATESGADTSAINGKVLVQGSLNVSETGSDTAAISGLVLVQGSLSATEFGADTATINGQVLVQGSLDGTETGQDIASFSSQQIPPVTGSLAATETGVDVASILGKIFVSGNLDATETGQDVAQFISQQPTPAPTGVGGFVTFSSRSALIGAADRMLALMSTPIVEQTPKVKKLVKRLEDVSEQDKPRVATVETLAVELVQELARQEKLAEFMVEARQLRDLINELKAIKAEVDDDEEEALLLLT